MHKIASVLLVGTLLLTGCSTAAAPDKPAKSSSTAVAKSTSYADIATLEEGIEHIRGISASTPNLAADMSGTAIKIGDLVPAAKFPFTVNNEIGQSLEHLNAAVLRAPEDAASQISEFNRIADEIEAAL